MERRRALGVPAFAMVVGSALLVVAILEAVLVSLGLALVIDVVSGLVAVWLVVTLVSGWLSRG
ncbi:MAG: hypothetical protein ABSE52_05875 [Candidatus Dormibacteria bacterium]